MVSKRTCSKRGDTVIYMFFILALFYLGTHIIYAIVREDSGFRNPVQSPIQTQYHTSAYEPTENGIYIDEAAQNYLSGSKNILGTK